MGERTRHSLMRGGQCTYVVHTYVYDRRIAEELGTNTPDNKFIVIAKRSSSSDFSWCGKCRVAHRRYVASRHGEARRGRVVGVIARARLTD